jgi:uncharacterized protein
MAFGKLTVGVYRDSFSVSRNNWPHARHRVVPPPAGSGSAVGGRVELSVAEGRVDVWVEHPGRTRFCCPDCERELAVYDHVAERVWRHLDSCALAEHVATTLRAQSDAMAPTVTDVSDRRRFEIEVDGAVLGFAEYRRRPGVITFLHTEIDPAHEGEGLGTLLVEAALDTARAEGLAVLPYCPFVRGFIDRHREYLDLVPVERRAKFALDDG